MVTRTVSYRPLLPVLELILAVNNARRLGTDRLPTSFSLYCPRRSRKRPIAAHRSAAATSADGAKDSAISAARSLAIPFHRRTTRAYCLVDSGTQTAKSSSLDGDGAPARRQLETHFRD